MKEIEANKRAWSLVARDHYEAFSARLREEHSLLNDIVTRELGDLSGKKVIHLQCNTGADTLSLARMGARVTGVDLVPANVHYARKMAKELGVENARFIESDVLALADIHGERYDVVFTSEGAIGWLPDLHGWGHTIRHLLDDDGFFYIFDSHPFQLTFDEEKMSEDILEIAYPYFGREPDVDTRIGGYASEAKDGVNYFWMYSVGDVINALAGAGLHIEYFNEYDFLYFRLPGMEPVDKGLWRWPHYRGKLPFAFSLKASVFRPVAGID